MHGTKKFRDRVRRPVEAPDEVTTALGRWYATVLSWRPQQLALFVHDTTLVPVLMPLAPAATVLDRFPARLAELLDRHGVAPPVLEREIAAMTPCVLTSTASRRLVGIMNKFTHLARAWRNPHGIDDLDELWLRLAQTPCSPLCKRNISPDREITALPTHNQP